MKLPPAKFLVATGIASAALVSLTAVLGGTRFEFLEFPFWAPGFFAAAIVFPQGIEGGHAVLYLVLVCLLNFVFTWFAVLLLMECFKNFRIEKRHE
jgi:hypothetical protein